mmetsp:Transcript_8731/g.26833  ORF Transcript_8731/g.26833 Transcript_8731/m.26833 type:complete len:102 (+) Transcript_8731:28-333(+)
MALSGWCAPLAADGKVTVVFKHAGDAPILKKCTFKLPATATLALVAEQLRKQLGLATQEPLFLYCSTAFAPPPDQRLGDVAQCFQVGSSLVLHYSTTPAWG